MIQVVHYLNYFIYYFLLEQYVYEAYTLRGIRIDRKQEMNGMWYYSLYYSLICPGN